MKLDGLHRSTEFRSYDVRGGREVVFTEDCPSGVLVPSGTAKIARYCNRFATLEDHINFILTQRAESNSSAGHIADVLALAAESGMLVSYNALSRNLQRTGGVEESSGPLDVLAIVTADRPQELELCLQSYSTARLDHNLPKEILLMSDSRTARNGDLTQALAYSLQKSSGINVRYAGLTERQEYAQRLAAKGIPYEVAHFALAGANDAQCTTGANRNAALLETIGQRFLMADDDTAHKLAVHPAFQSGVRLGSHKDPADFWFFRSREEAAAAAQWKAIDIFTEHGTILGRRLSDFAASKPDMTASCHHVLAHTLDGLGRIRLTTSGVVGDSGMFSSSSFLTNEAAASRMSISDLDYNNALHSREVIRVPQQTTITHNTGCMAMTIGIDNRGILPPFLPVYRNQDGVFAALLSVCSPDTFTGHLPIAVLHQPKSGRVYQRPPADPQYFRVSELIICLCSVQQFLLGKTEARMSLLGQLFREIADLPKNDLVSHISNAVRSMRGLQLKLLDAQLRSDTSYSLSVRNSINQLYNASLVAMLDPNCWVPAELRPLSTDDAYLQTRHIIQLTGDLLAWWPALNSAALELRHQGVRITKQTSPCMSN
jgi:hypothetical protein